MKIKLKHVKKDSILLKIKEIERKNLIVLKKCNKIFVIMTKCRIYYDILRNNKLRDMQFISLHRITRISKNIIYF